MKRRTFIALFGSALAAWPLGASGQQRPLRFGYLASGGESTGTTLLNGIRKGLSENNLTEGKDYFFDARWAEGQYDRFPAFAREIVAANPAVIIVTTIAGARAAQSATSIIPIVMASMNDPVGNGIVASLARPGGNTTGLATLNQDATPKLMELLKGLLPEASSIAILFNPSNPSNLSYLNNVRLSAESARITARSYDLKNQAELESVFKSIESAKPDALMIIPDASTLDLGERIAAWSLQHRIPVISTAPELTAAGGLASYGVSRWENYRRSGYFIKRILDGARPADLPVEQPTRILVSINLKSARLFGISAPNDVLVRADEVIE